jgi:hypothetical protein
VTKRLFLAQVLGASVRAAGSEVGVVSDLYADPAAEYLVGLEVTGPTGRLWFLPWAAVTVEGGAVLASSPLAFVPAERLGFYMEHGARLANESPDDVLVEADGRLGRPLTDESVSSLRGEGSAVS